jgi:membrane fusion protein (multidrug efflux system)
VTRRFPGGLAGVALAALLAGGCGGGEKPGAASGGPPPPVVEVLRLTPRTIENEAELLGQLEAAESVMVRSEVPGVIESVEFEEGQPVKQGSVLFRLRDDEQVARLHEAQADLDLAQDSFRRTRSLADRDAASAAQLERVTAELAAARARVEAAQVELDRTQIRAPFDGLTGARLVSPGARVEPETDLVSIDAIANLQLVFSLPEQVLPLARTGVPLELTVAPYPDRVFPGEVYFLAPSLNPRNRRLLVKARVPNPDLLLRPGLFAKVQARVGRHENALVLPPDAIVYGSQGSFVWRVDEDKAVAPVDVELGVRTAEGVEVRSGLRPGDVVVVAGTNKLSPGIHVEVESREADTGLLGGPEAEPPAAAPAGAPTREGEG